MTKVKVFPNPAYDFTIMDVGGFDDIPTKQDKYKPIKAKSVSIEYPDGSKETLLNEIYIINEKKKLGQQNFESKIKDLVRSSVDSTHPYLIPKELQVVIGVNMSRKRKASVDIDNLAKCILDCLNGLVYEDDSQISSLFVFKHVIEDEFIPQISGYTIGIRILNEDRPEVFNEPIYFMEHLSEDEE